MSCFLFYFCCYYCVRCYLYKVSKEWFKYWFCEVVSILFKNRFGILWFDNEMFIFDNG